MAAAGLTIDPYGYFTEGRERFVPVGAAYWPASCGSEMWKAWPALEIQGDLDLLRSLGLNSVRFFLRWQDFEPAAGKYDEAVFARLEELLGWCAARGLRAMPVLFAPFSGGAALGPTWRGRRNYFHDDFMRQRAVDFAFTAARVISPHQSELLGIDIGHELCRLPDCQTAATAHIRTWCQSVASAVRGASSQALIVCGNGSDLITRDTGWRIGELAGCDLLAMHGSTLPRDNPVTFDGLTDPLCQSLLPMYTEIARSFAPVLVQDIALAPSAGAKVPGAYLREVLPACWSVGANGFLWTAFRDTHQPAPAAIRPGIDGTLGLINEEGALKPGLEYFCEFANTLSELARPRLSANFVGLYLPKHYYPRDNPENAGNLPPEVSRSIATANYHLRNAGHAVHFVRGDRPINPRTRTIFIAGCHLRPDEAAALTPWVEAGGRLIWHGPDPLNWGKEYDHLLGATPVDYRAPREVMVEWAAAEWKIGVYPRDVRLQIETADARVVVTDDTGLPVVLRHGLGRGIVTYALPWIDEAVARGPQEPMDRDRCTKWYEAMLGA